jgi:23S rRNA (guanine745-N1)-methyltransferase
MAAVDISKDALAAGAKRCPGLKLAVASVFRLPVRGGFLRYVAFRFRSVAADEFRRVLKDGGVMIRVVPLERHLTGLKEAVYDKSL